MIYYNFCFIYLDDILAVSVDMLLHAINESSFNAEKSVLLNIVADITNSSRSAVELILDDDVPPGWFENMSYISVSVKPRDKTHENYVISKINLSYPLRDEINLRMQNETTETNINVSRIAPIYRTPCKLN